jgi:hypothetical protein
MQFAIHIIHNVRTMSSSESDTFGSDADRIRRNDKSLTHVKIYDKFKAVKILDALKNNTVVRDLSIYAIHNVYELHNELLPDHQEVNVKLPEVIKFNKSVKSLSIFIEEGLLRERLFAAMATSGGWSPIQELVLYDSSDHGVDFVDFSLRGAEHLSSFIIQCENLRTLPLEVPGDETGPIMETLLHTKVQSLKIWIHQICTIHNGGRRLAAALERCTCITELRLEFPFGYDRVELLDKVEFFQILSVESIPKMLGLKKLELEIFCNVDQGFFGMVGQYIGGHQGEIEELRLILIGSSVNLSIVGLAPALRRLKVFQFDGDLTPTLLEISKLSVIAVDCDALEEFEYTFFQSARGLSIKEFKAICRLLPKFPSLKRVTQEAFSEVDLREEGRLTAFLEMLKTSKTIEQVPSVRCGNLEESAAIKQHCRNNMMHNQIELIRKKGLLAAKVPSSAWPLILNEFSGMSDLLYYLLQQKHCATIGPTCHGCKRKQDFE